MKKILSLALALVILAVSATAVLAGYTAHDWALEELEAAYYIGLIPESLENADLTQNITRAEFAAVSVRTYEAITGISPEPVAVNPFTDCSDPYVLKAYAIGAVNGTSDTTFSPDALLTREQAATMLTRVFKKVIFEDWTLEHDADFTLTYQKPAPFADDDKISDYAKESVYFMAAYGIINGVGGNKFAPRATTEAEKAAGYAQATREQALLIAERMVKKMG